MNDRTGICTNNDPASGVASSGKPRRTGAHRQTGPRALPSAPDHDRSGDLDQRIPRRYPGSGDRKATALPPFR